MMKNLCTLASMLSLIFVLLASATCTPIYSLDSSDAYLTPIAPATFDAFDFNQPVETQLQAVNAALHAIQTSRLDWVGDPVPIFVEKMDYKDAKKHFEAPETTSYDNPERLNTPAWLVVFSGEWTLTPPMGTTSPPSPECVLAVIKVNDGMMMTVGGSPCDKWK